MVQSSCPNIHCFYAELHQRHHLADPKSIGQHAQGVELKEHLAGTRKFWILVPTPFQVLLHGSVVVNKDILLEKLTLPREVKICEDTGESRCIEQNIIPQQI